MLVTKLESFETGPHAQRARRDEREADHSSLAGGRFNKQGNLHIRLGFGNYRMSRFPHLPTTILKVYKRRDFTGDPVIKTSPSNAGGAGSIPGRRGKIPCTLQPKKHKIETI